MDIKNVTVIGAGTMGNGIAHTFAFFGYNVMINDVSQTSLDKGLNTIKHNLGRQVSKGLISDSDVKSILSRIQITKSLDDAVSKAELIIEAATEDKEVKLAIFKSLKNKIGQTTLLASNTSSISITELASVTPYPENVVGMHFMNPVPVMKLVEVIRGKKTSPSVIDEIEKVTDSLQKTPITVNDFPGFIANRILMPMINEAIYSYYEGVADVKAIDEIMQLGMAHPMGPLKLADFIGLDVCLSILKVMEEGFGDSKYSPCPLLINMVKEGKLGVKTKQGFYQY